MSRTCETPPELGAMLRLGLTGYRGLRPGLVKLCASLLSSPSTHMHKDHREQHWLALSPEGKRGGGGGKAKDHYQKYSLIPTPSLAHFSLCYSSIIM